MAVAVVFGSVCALAGGVCRGTEFVSLCGWGKKILVECSSPNLTCAAVDNCSTAKRGNGTRCDAERDSVSRNEELFLLEVAGGLGFSTGVKSTEMKFMLV